MGTEARREQFTLLDRAVRGVRRITRRRQPIQPHVLKPSPKNTEDLIIKAPRAAMMTGPSETR